MPLLEVTDLCTGYGALTVVHRVSFHVGSGETVALLGRNGAGKTTTLKAVAGLLTIKSGTVEFGGSSIGGLTADEIAARSIALVPEGRMVFPQHSVRENLELGAYELLRRGERSAFQTGLDNVLTIFPRLAERLKQQAGSLSGGEQQMLAIARGLIRAPRLLVLDEPSLGLSPLAAHTVFEALEKVRAQGMTMLIVEQMARKALAHSDRAYVIENGHTVLTGTSTDLIEHPLVAQSYLGGNGHHLRRSLV